MERAPVDIFKRETVEGVPESWGGGGKKREEAEA